VSSQLFNVPATDTPVALLAMLMLTLIAVAAGLVPTRRATVIDPIKTLRYE
jgi:ABC-type lipoprotein release transport system permease subunit